MNIMNIQTNIALAQHIVSIFMRIYLLKKKQKKNKTKRITGCFVKKVNERKKKKEKKFK